jgi:biotin carboxylase
MSLFYGVSDRSVILVAGGIRHYNVEHFARSVSKIEDELKRKIEIVFVTDTTKARIDKSILAKIPRSTSIHCNLKSIISIEKTLLPYSERMLLVVCRMEEHIPVFKAVIPHVPYLLTPTAESLDWTTDKIQMRRRLHTFNPKLTPTYAVAEDDTEATIKRIAKKVGFPAVVKPAGLAASLLVSVCYDEEELRDSIKSAFSYIKKAYKDYSGRGEPQILVEKFFEGSMYSIDAYVGARGRVYTCPPVHVKTGRAIGIDDFHGYQQLTPVKLQKHKVDEAEAVAKDAVKAIGLRNVTCHVELILTERNGWKIVEVAARPGGFRDTLYELAYGFDHIKNDMMIRLPKRPVISRKPKGFAVAMKFFPREEGKLIKLAGVEEAREFESFHKLMVNKKEGDTCKYAKHGGKSVFDIMMFNKSRAKLIADIRRLERTVIIRTEPS